MTGNGEQATTGAGSTPPRWTVRRGGLAGTLLLVFLPMVIGLLIILTVVGSFISLHLVETQTVNQLELVASLKEQEISRWVRERERDLAVLASEPLLREQVAHLLDEKATEAERLAAYSGLGIRLNDFLESKVSFAELFLLDAASGQTVISTDVLQEGYSHRDADYFQQGLLGPYLRSPEFDPRLNVPTLLLARPVVAEEGRVVGVLVGRVNLGDLSVLMLERTGLGETGETYMVDRDFQPITQLRFGPATLQVDTVGAHQALVQRTAGSSRYTNYQATPVFGVYRWIPGLQVALLAEQSEAEVLGGLALLMVVVLPVVVIGAGLLATAIVFYVSRRITRPIVRLTQAATEMAAGDLSQRVTVERRDEIGALSQAFDGMADQLTDLIGTLEQRVAERTRELGQRSLYLEAAAQVGRAAASILDADLLIRQVTELIRQRFDLYYVGLFLVDEPGEWAVLRAGTGEAGRAMLARGHRIRVGEGMVGWCVDHAQARVALEVGEDAMRLATAELPLTRSEAALPLRSRGRVLGAITVQHTEPGAFDPDTIVVLQTMADQVAVALDNARLFAETQEALESTRRAYGELSRQAWIERSRVQPDLGCRRDQRGTLPVGDVWRPQMEMALRTGQISLGQGEEATRLTIPIRVRGQVIGVIDAHKPDSAGEWTTEEITLLETLTDQLSATLDSARLFEETQRRARDEQELRAITAQVRDAPGLEAILQTAVQEVARAWGVERAFVQLGAPPPLESQDKG